MQKIVLKQFVITLLLIGFSAISYATVSECEKKISISVAKDWPPFSYLENDKYVGLDIEIVEAVLTNANYCWEYISYPSSIRALVEMKKNNIDFIFAASFTTERAQYATYSVAYRYETMQLFGSAIPGAQTEINDESLIAINRGSYYGANFDNYIKHCVQCTVETNIVTERINLIKKNRVNFAAEELLAGNYIIQTQGLSDYVKPTDITINSTPVYFMLNRENFSEEDVAQLNKAIKESDQAINKIVTSYQKKYGF